jgi:hypothetical protein
MRSTHAGIPVLDFCAPKSVRTARPALSPILGRIAALALAAGLFAAAPQAAALLQPAHAATAR